MKTKRRTEITVEVDELLVLRQRRNSAQTWCERCSETVRLITPDEAALMAGVTARTIYRWIETERLHFKETAEGLLLICLNSLSLRKH